ncbi:MAG: aldo/keto reductase [Deltaproteobacteria bacterium]|nr:aldo/keto reductase [Deltaproteobacteria bacterium]
MQTRTLGRDGPSIAEIGQGTWALEQADRTQAIRALHRGIELGLTHVDTAELYGRGAVEELLGEALEGKRDQVFLASKVLPTNASHAGTVAACEASLKRLRTDHLDLYLLHWASELPIADTIAAFEQLKQEGKIRHWGLSNFDARRLRRVVEIAGAGKVACNQVGYHVRERGPEREVIPTCAELGIALVAYSPLGQGNFPGTPSPGGRLLRDIGKRHGVGPHAVALRFLLRFPNVLVIPKAASRAHVEENARAADLALTAEDVAQLEEMFLP